MNSPIKYNDENEVLKLLRGEPDYVLGWHQMEMGLAVPTNILAVIEHIYSDKSNKPFFERALVTLANGSAADVYMAFLYYDLCISRREKGIESFKINLLRIRYIIEENLIKHRAELENKMVFHDGTTAAKPWDTIESWNKQRTKKYRFSFF